jgi:hypothetical protein
VTTYAQGSTAALAAQFREFAPDGPLTNVDNLTITIVPLLGGDAVLATTSVGITNPATGIYGYAWFVPFSAAVGQYVVIWEGDDPGTGDPVTATEQIGVTLANAQGGSTGDGPCGWTIDTSCCADWDTLPASAQVVGYELATMTLWAATGRRFGRCEITVQPCRQRKNLPLYQVFPVPAWGFGYGNGAVDGLGWFGPYIVDGEWFNGCSGGCRCRASCEVALDGPTTTAGILQVTVNGEVISPAAYQVQDNHLLVRIDGQCWPTCVDYSEQNPPAFTVTYLRGNEEPSALQIASGILACEFAKACAGDESCRLPSRLQALSQQGVSVTVSPFNEYLDLGMTDIPEVDRVIVALNPYRQQERSRVYSPDRPRPRMVT